MMLLTSVLFLLLRVFRSQREMEFRKRVCERGLSLWLRPNSWVLRIMMS